MIIDSTKTAIRRIKESRPARIIKERNFLNQSTSILDWGCGFGNDINYYSYFFEPVCGYEINPKSSYNVLPNKKFQVIACTYVLNTISYYQCRCDCIAQMLEYLKPNGSILLSARTEREINRLAKKKNWPAIYDGYLTSATRKTFQKGITESELKQIAKDLDLSIIFLNLKGYDMPNTIMAEFRFKNTK